MSLQGIYFKERFSDNSFCGNLGFIVIRESILITDFPEIGVAVHVDVCEANLFTEFEPGKTNEDVSRQIVRSLRKQN